MGDPLAVGTRWAEVLGVPLPVGRSAQLRLDGAQVSFVAAENERGEGLVEIAIEDSPQLRRLGQPIELGGVRLRSVEAA